jgi:predicted transcriptional regulator
MVKIHHGHQIGKDMTTMKFENLVDVNTGKTVEIEVPDDYTIDELPGKRAKEFANCVRQVNSLDEVAELGREAGRKLAEAMGIKNLK